jgi:hypothetical protein
MPTQEPSYTFKPKPELIWFIAVAVLTVAMQALAEFDPAMVTDWQAWAVGLGAALVRAGAGAFLAYVARHGVTYEEDNPYADYES